MPDRPFHHGNLRAVLLAEAAESLRSDGLDGLSLRELARRAGVSHAAPRRHFPDRQALLEALAVDGFRRVTARMLDAGQRDGRSWSERFRAVASAFVTFATHDAALLEVMFSTTGASPASELAEAAGAFFAANEEFFASAPAGAGRADAERRRRLVVPTLRGIAMLAASGRLGAEDVEQLLDDATAVLGAAGTG